MDYGPHTPFIAAAYGVSIIVIGAMIAFRLYRFRKAMRAEDTRRQSEN